MTQRTSIDQFSYIRILACFCIIILYSLFASNVYFEETITDSELLWTKAMENMLMWAIPSFLMITGVLLLDKDRVLPLKKLFGKYLWRVALALVCFTLIFQILGYYKEGEPTILAGWLHDLAFGESWAHMWYLYLMIGLYLLMPFYRMVAVMADEKQLDYLIIVLLIFTSVLPTLRVFGWDVGFYISTALVYPTYLFLGYRLYHRPMPAWAGALLLIFCSAAIIALTYLRYGTDVMAAMEADPECQLDVLYGYSSILVVGQTAGFFSLMNRIKSPASNFVKGVDKCTFGVYLMHMIGIHMVMKWWDFDPYMYGPFTFILMGVAFFIPSCIITWIIRKIPKLNLL